MAPEEIALDALLEGTRRGLLQVIAAIETYQKDRRRQRLQAISAPDDAA